MIPLLDFIVLAVVLWVALPYEHPRRYGDPESSPQFPREKP